MKSTSKKSVSVIIPALNEEFNIATVINKAKNALETLGVEYEIVVVDSDSTDKTVEIAKSLGAVVVNQPLRGYGNAYHKGFSEAKGDVFVIGDADDTYDFNEIIRFVPPILNDECDFVIGSRLRGEKIPGAMPPLHRHLGTPVLTFFINLLFGTKISDSNCGLRAFSREAFMRLNVKSPGWEYASEQIIKAGIEKLRIKEIPITLYPDKKGRRPHLNPWKAGMENMTLIFMYSPKWLFIYPGLLFFALGLLLFSAFFFFPKENIKLPAFGLGDHTLILSSFLMLAGYQVTWFGTMAHFYTSIHRFEKLDNFSNIILKNKVFTLEFNAIIGLFLLSIGLAFIGFTVYRWVSGNLGDPQSVRLILHGSALFALGILNIFNGFLINMMIKEYTYRVNLKGLKD